MVVPKLSVSMISFNQEPFVARAVEGVLMQKTTFPIELVVGDDHSTDGTREILTTLQRERPDVIRLLPSERNLGAIRNFTRTIGTCRGQYVALLDGDDYWTSPCKLQLQADFLDLHPECASCFHRVTSVFEDGHSEPTYPAGRMPAYTLDDILLRNFIPTCSMVFRNRLFDSFPAWYFEKPVIGDWELHVLNAQFGKIGYLDEDMGVYRIHAGGMFTGISFIEKTMRRIEAAKFLKEQLPGKYKRLLKRNLSSQYFGLVNAHLERGELAMARQGLLASLKQAPLYRLSFPGRYGVALLRVLFPRVARVLAAGKRMLTGEVAQGPTNIN
jgi:glycosyltransferase involved in cell wall biosynthesis